MDNIEYKIEEGEYNSQGVPSNYELWGNGNFIRTFKTLKELFAYVYLKSEENAKRLINQNITDENDRQEHLAHCEANLKQKEEDRLKQKEAAKRKQNDRSKNRNKP